MRVLTIHLVFLFKIISVISLVAQPNIKRCDHDHKMSMYYAQHPGYEEQVEEGFASFRRNFMKIGQVRMTGTIPVHVIIIHPPGQAIGTGDNFSLEHIQSQINVLNEDFGRYNGDAQNTPPQFPASDTGIQFCLASVDPDGNPTTGVTRYPYSGNFESNEFAVKQATRWPRADYLNIWSVPGLSNLGFAYLPSTSSLPNATLDGVVVNADAFGGPGYGTFPNYDLGRTATHEVGHYLGLQHVWRNSGCGQDDGIPDTPLQDDENYGCPSHPSPSCGNSGDMFMSYMDYTNDNCMNAFSTGQGNYMMNILSGVRSSLLASSSVVCVPPEPLSLAVISQQNPLCYLGEDGLIEVEASGGASPYMYQINNGTTGNNPVFSGLASGTYIVTVIDDNGDEVSVTITLSDPDQVDGFITDLMQNDCFGGLEGSFEVQPTGGTGNNYTFSLNGANPTQSSLFQGLGNGEYEVIIYDGNQCSNFLVVEIVSPPAITWDTLTIDLPACHGNNNGRFHMQAMGGVGDFVYQLSGRVSQLNGNFTSLAAGRYNFTVSDGNSCMIADSFLINQPQLLTFDAVNISRIICHGDSTGMVECHPSGGSPPYQYILNDSITGNQGSFELLPAGTHAISILDTNNCRIDTSFTLIQPDPVTIQAEITPVSCQGGADGAVQLSGSGGNGAPFQYYMDSLAVNNGLFTGLSAQNYRFTAVDSLGCTDTVTVDVPVISNMFVANLDYTDVNCYGDSTGRVQLNAGGGVPVYFYTLGTETTSTGQFNNLTSGTYLIVVTDSLGCVIRDSVVISQPAQALRTEIIRVDFGTGKGDAEAEVQGVGGTPPYRYSIDGGMTFQDNGIFRSLPPGQIRILVRDSLGCENVIDILISSSQNERVTGIWWLYPNPAFDYIYIKNKEEAKSQNIQLSVIDQNGRLVFQNAFNGLTNDGYKLNCDILLPGVYSVLLTENERTFRMRFVKL